MLLSLNFEVATSRSPVGHDKSSWGLAWLLKEKIASSWWNRWKAKDCTSFALSAYLASRALDKLHLIVKRVIWSLFNFLRIEVFDHLKGNYDGISEWHFSSSSGNLNINFWKKIKCPGGWLGGDVEALIWDSALSQGKFSKEEWKRLCQQGRVNNVY